MTCKVCKKWFSVGHSMKFCSSKCKEIRMKELRKGYNKKKIKKEIKKREVICKACDNVFLTSNSTQKFCKWECSEKMKDPAFVLENMEKLKDVGGKHIAYLKLRIMLFDRDNFTCRYCGRSPMKDTNVQLHLDHKIPKNLGGKDSKENLITACLECNLGKSDYLLDLWKDKKHNKHKNGNRL